MDLRKEMGLKLKKARQLSGLTQREVSEALGYSTPQYVSNIERGLSLPPEKHLYKFAKVLDADYKDLTSLVVKGKQEELELYKKRAK